MSNDVKMNSDMKPNAMINAHINDLWNPDTNPAADDTITVVIPTWQSASYIIPTMNSIRSQTHQQLEILVVDDGSTDDTLAIVSALNDPRIQTIALPHQGAPGHCRNHGMDMATSPYLIFFDSDDMMYPTMLADMLAIMKQKEADLVIGNARHLHIETKQPMPSQVEWFFAKNEHTLTDLFQINPFPCNKLYRTVFLRSTNVRYLEGVFNQDLGFFICNLIHQPRFEVVSPYVMDYMVRQGSITTSKQTRKKHIDIIAVFDQVFAEWEKAKYDKAFEYGIYHMFIRSMVFKASFFDLLDEPDYINQIRGNLITYCPAWYRRKEFTDYYPWKKQIYNRLLLQYQLYAPIGYYKKWKSRMKGKGQ